MLDDLVDFFRKSLSNPAEAILAIDDQQIYSNMNYQGTKYFISPLQNAHSAPSLLRNFHGNQVDSSPYRKWSTLIDGVIRSGYELFIVLYGLSVAEKWQLAANNFKSRMLAARGPIGLFDSEYSLFWIYKEANFDKDGKEDQVDVLAFNTDLSRNEENDTPSKLKVAERNNRKFKLLNNNEDPKGLNGMVVFDDRYQNLLQSLSDFLTSWSHQSTRTHHHLYFWSSHNLANFKPSFVNETIALYLDKVSGSIMFSTYGILMAKLDSKSEMRTLNNLEILCLKRVRPGSIIFISNGVTKSSKIDIANFISELGAKIQEFTDFKSSVFYHEDQIENSEFTEIAIIFPVWSGMWKESIDIDGEQVIFEN